MRRAVMIGILLTAIISGATGQEVAEPALDSYRVVLMHAAAPHEQAVPEIESLSEKLASYKPDFALPFAKISKVQIRRKRGLSIFVEFDCSGKEDRWRKVLVDLWVRDRDAQTIYHTWELQPDARITAGENIDPRVILATKNQASFTIPKEHISQAVEFEVRLRALTGPKLDHFPTKPHPLKLAMTRPDKVGNFELVFGNRPDSKLSPQSHEIALVLTLRNQGGMEVDREVRFLEYRTDGDYRIPIRIDPALILFSHAAISVYTKQEFNDVFRRDFFLDQKGSQYSGQWWGDGSHLRELPFEDSLYR